MGRPTALRAASRADLSEDPTRQWHRGVRSGMGERWPCDLVLIQRLRVIVDVGQRRRDRTLARPVGVVGGSPGFRRGSARRANDEVDDGEPPGTGSFSWGGLDQRRPSPPEAAAPAAIPALWCSSGSGWRWGVRVRGGDENGVKRACWGGLLI